MLRLIRIIPIPISKDPNAIALAGLRIMVGIFFTIFGEYKVFGTQFMRGGFQTYVEGFIRGGAYPFMIPMLKGYWNIVRFLWPLPWLMVSSSLGYRSWSECCHVLRASSA
jgi:hypothetical protein